jgi:asparagine synthase (glutamine-hydrolysing)
MCGIAGFIHKEPREHSQQRINKMLESIAHRGPDQNEFGIFNHVTLGMTRLSIVCETEDTIPYTDESGRYSVVYNGEIYNHDEIRSSLRYNFTTSSDAQTVLANFIAKGVDSFNDYNGMYAFALYDSKGDKLYLVRDKVGEKPLYYTQKEKMFLFASEIKALLLEVDAHYFDALSYKAYEFVVGEETLFEGIHSILPGEYLVVSSGSVYKHSYWKIWENLDPIEDNQNKILNHLAELLEDSILLRTKNCAHEYGAFVSGGIDSSLVACIAKPDFLLTAHYDYSDFDELDYAKLVADQLGKDLCIVTPTKEDFLRTQKEIAYHLDTPCTWTSFTLYRLMEEAKKNGMKVMMTGDGADEVFGGYHRYHLLHHDEQIHKLEAMQQYSFMINKYYGSTAERYGKLVNRYENIYDEEVQKYVLSQTEKYIGHSANDIVHGMGMHDFYTTMQVLLQMSDRMSMAFAIENRSPFLDHRLIEFAFSMPSKYKINNGITKWALKEVARKFIPKEIVNRIDKRGFSAPVNKWFEWDKSGKYNRNGYRQLAFEDWREQFNPKGLI